MDELRKQVRRAQWKLGVQRFVRVLGWCWFAALLMALGITVAAKFRPPRLDGLRWGETTLGEAFGSRSVLFLADLTVLAAALLVGLLAAAVWALWTRRPAIDAAIEIDRRFGLKERVSSALAMSAEEHQSEVGQTLVADTVRRVERIDVAEQFPIVPGRQILLPLGPAVAVLLVAWLVTPAGESPAQAKPSAALQKQLDASSQSVQRRLAEKREQAKKEGLKDAQELFQRLEQELGAPGAPKEKSETLAKLHDLAQQLEKRRQELGGNDMVEKQLEQLKNLGQGPADKFLQAVAKGDMKNAIKELEKLKDDLQNGKLSDKEREELAKQVEGMKKKMEDLAQAHRKAQQDLQKQIDQARKAGQDGEADKLQEQLRKLQEQMPQMEQLQQMAEKLGQCGQCLKDGQAAEAAKMLDQMRGDLERLQDQLEECKMLGDAIDQLEQARQKITCPECDGEGCQACDGDGDPDGKPGPGLGKGRGAGPRPEEQTPYKTYDTKAQVKSGKGAGSVVGEVDGPSVKGDVQQKFTEAYQGAKAQAADPLTEQKMSRKHRQHAQEYFDRFRENR